MNVLEVPVQANLVDGRNVSSTSIDSLVFTLDPKDKYLPPGVRRAATTSAIQKRKARMSAVPKIIHRAASTPLQSASPPRTSNSTRAGQSTLERQRSLMSVFQRMRQTRSAGSNTKSTLAWPRKLFSRAGQSVKADATEEIPEVPKLPIQIPSVPVGAKAVELHLPIQRPLTAQSVGRASQKATEAAEQTIVVPWPQESTPFGELQPAFVYAQKSRSGDKPDIGNFDTLSEALFSPPPEDFGTHEAYFANFSAVVGGDVPPGAQEHAANPSILKDYADRTIDVNEPVEQQAPAERASSMPATAEGHQQPYDTHYATAHTYESSRFSYAPSEDLSPDLTSNTTHSGPMSPIHLSQPETPTMSDFGDDHEHDYLQLRRCSRSSVPLALDVTYSTNLTTLRPPSRAPPPPPPPPGPVLTGFQGYSLPQDDCMSVLTIRKMPSTALKISEAGQPYSQHSGKQDRVHSWNDGSEHLLDDLGYLGELIA